VPLLRRTLLQCGTSTTRTDERWRLLAPPTVVLGVPWWLRFLVSDGKQIVSMHGNDQCSAQWLGGTQRLPRLRRRPAGFASQWFRLCCRRFVAVMLLLWVKLQDVCAAQAGT
jgi:hypothetical protein